jgi:hypothetical protein
VSYFFLAGTIEGILTLVFTMLIPPDPKNAWLFGYSKYRLILAGSIFLVSAIFAGLFVKTWRDKEWSHKLSGNIKVWVDKLGWFLPVIWCLFILIIFAPYIYLLQKPDLHHVIERLMPIIFWSFFLCVQMLILVFIFKKETVGEIPRSMREEIVIEIKPFKVAMILGIIFVLMLIISISFSLLENIVNDNNLLHYTHKMHFDSEGNVATHYSSVLLLSVAALFGVIAVLKNNEHASYSYQWVFLAILFLFFSIDEVAGLHEMLNKPVSRWLSPQGIFSFGWVVIGIPLVFLFVIAYLRFFFHLPIKFRRLFALASICYIAGALGFELIGAGYSDIYGRNLVYDLIATTEEALEITGLILTIYALLTYFDEYSNQRRFTIRLTERKKAIVDKGISIE